MLYGEILAFLRILLPGLRRSRLKTLSWLVAGALRGSDWPHKRTLASLARAIPRQVSFEARKKQLHRFLANKGFSLGAFSRILWLGLVRRLPQGKRVAVSLDWVMGGDWALLGAALPSPSGRALLFAQKLLLQRELTLMQNHIELSFIRFLKGLFALASPLGVSFVLVADRGFAKSNLLGPLLNEVKFVIRTKGKLAFYPGEGKGPVLLQTIASRLSAGQVWQGRGLVHQRWRLPLRVVVTVGPDEPWILLTNIEDLPPEQVIGLYAQRFLIEESFRDFQRGVLDFMRMLPRLEEQHRREQWLILGTLAHWVSMKLGEAVEMLGQLKELAPVPWRKLRARGYHRVLSLCRLGVLAARFGFRAPNWWLPHPLIPGFT